MNEHAFKLFITKNFAKALQNEFIIYALTDNEYKRSYSNSRMIYQINQQVIEHNRTIKTSSHST